MELQRVVALTDGDGHWYVIPLYLKDTFKKVLEDCESADDYTSFELKFERYRTGGDLNLIQLWADI